MRFYEIPQSTFQGLVTESGLLLKNFDLEAAATNPATPGFLNSDIICATTGGVNISLVPTYSDMGEDVDNCPLNMKELKHLDSWEGKIGATGLGLTAQNIHDMVGAADVEADGKTITPRMNLEQTDFQTIWWVSDKANGGFVAAKLTNGLSTGGLSLQTGKNTKGQITLEFTGHVSLNAQNVVPLTFYSVDPAESDKLLVTQNLTHVTSSFTATSITAETELEAVLTAESTYTLGDVTVKMGGVDITASVYDEDTGTVTISSVTDYVTITAVATKS